MRPPPRKRRSRLSWARFSLQADAGRKAHGKALSREVATPGRVRYLPVPPSGPTPCQARRAVPAGEWCNGNTAVFGTVILGSSPGIPANLLTEVAAPSYSGLVLRPLTAATPVQIRLGSH